MITVTTQDTDLSQFHPIRCDIATLEPNAQDEASGINKMDEGKFAADHYLSEGLPLVCEQGTNSGLVWTMGPVRVTQGDHYPDCLLQVK